MTERSGAIVNQVIKVGAEEVWRQARMVGCLIIGGPASSLSLAEDVGCINCVFLYDGMEVDCHEWASLMRRGVLLGAPMAPREQ